ncbi:MAG: hypothetical protein COW59_05025 [Lysobacterales bacterium CG17_big_fil_post_rev_8_21_14_2_50_64_11]|nr:MAG: hypothetical protein COW59_05025 [Xanthomonadales bacterium CG17_big_fil_post_rev_8_21_14_2_50_64_11]PIX60035.1 MAG: hypothetical protein COZ47_09335 [Xanthomonadales bacterium CG_4_10_14_3_um_filter_64_11]
MNITRHWLQCAVLSLALAFAVHAQEASPAQMPRWEQLSPAQREALSTPLRERWNQAAYEQRLRWLRQAERWQNLSPEDRKAARDGLRAYRKADPQTREKLRDVFQNLRNASPEQRAALREKWRSLSPEQRKRWLDAGGPGRASPPEQ